MTHHCFKDETGKRYDRWTVLGLSGKKNRCYYWNCQCDCGNTHAVIGSELRRGSSRSCGCLHKERSAIWAKTNPIFLKNQEKDEKSFRNHPLRFIRKAMIHRCYNPNNRFYKNYGGRDIKVCDDWLNSLQSFIEWSISNGWIIGLSIDRFDNDSHYTPENCRWITVSENSRKNCVLGKEVGRGRKKRDNSTK